MKITLSKAQWERIGKRLGWLGTKESNISSLEEASSQIDDSLKLLDIAGEKELWTELSIVNNKIIDRMNELKKWIGE